MSSSWFLGYVLYHTYTPNCRPIGFLQKFHAYIDPNYRTSGNGTVFEKACQYRDTEMCKLLLSLNFAKPIKFNEPFVLTPLLCACEYNNIAVLKMLLADDRVDPNYYVDSSISMSNPNWQKGMLYALWSHGYNNNIWIALEFIQCPRFNPTNDQLAFYMRKNFVEQWQSGEGQIFKLYMKDRKRGRLAAQMYINLGTPVKYAASVFALITLLNEKFFIVFATTK